MKIKLDRIISLATLVAALVAIVLVLKRPASTAPPQAPAASAAHADSSDRYSGNHDSSDHDPSDRGSAGYDSANQRTSRPQAATQGTQAGGEYESPKPGAGQVASVSGSQAAVQGTAGAASPKGDSHADEIGSMVAKLLGNTGGGNLSPDANVGTGEPNIKDQQVTMEGDIVHGRFLTEMAGKDVWVTISGHMGEKDGYATFDPTEFKVGDTEVPVALVNPELQRKLAEQRDRLKIPNN